MGFAAAKLALEKSPMSCEAYLLYARCKDKYVGWSKSYRWGLESMECGGIQHPSKSITEALREHLIDRGFDKDREGYWRDLRGAQINIFEWFDRPYMSCRLKYVAGSSNYNYVEDPAGMQEIHARYEAVFDELEGAAAQTRKCYEEARDRGASAFKAGLYLSDCPHEVGTVDHYGWTEPWGKNITWESLFREGKEAHGKGMRLGDCPYAEATFESQNWRDGWESGNDPDCWR